MFLEHCVTVLSELIRRNLATDSSDFGVHAANMFHRKCNHLDAELVVHHFVGMLAFNWINEYRVNGIMERWVDYKYTY